MGINRMVNLKSLWILFVVVAMTLTLTTMPILSGAALAAKRSSSSGSSSGGTKIFNKMTTPIHIRGVKVFRVHTVPSKVAVGSTFNLRGIVFNNSTATITFGNGTCVAPLSITFNKNVMTEPQTVSAACKTQTVTLKPGEQTPILSPNLSGKIFRATAPGVTNATLIFKYKAVTPTGKSHISDSISRTYAFDILATGSKPVSAPQTSPLTLH